MPNLWYFFFREALLQNTHRISSWREKTIYMLYLWCFFYSKTTYEHSYLRNVHEENKLKHLPKYSWKLMLNNMKNMAGVVQLKPHWKFMPLHFMKKNKQMNVPFARKSFLQEGHKNTHWISSWRKNILIHAQFTQ